MSKARHSAAGGAQQIPSSERHPGEDILWQEIESDRKGERWLVLKSIVALAFVGVLVVIRTLFFT